MRCRSGGKGNGARRDGAFAHQVLHADAHLAQLLAGNTRNITGPSMVFEVAPRSFVLAVPALGNSARLVSSIFRRALSVAWESRADDVLL